MAETPSVARAPFTLLDLLLVVIAFGFSAGMAVRAIAGQKDILPPLHWISMNPAGWGREHILYSFAGVVGLGPIVQGLQFLRFRRRRWTAIEWLWISLGTVYALFPLVEFALFCSEMLLGSILPEWLLFWTGFVLYVGFYGGPGIAALVLAAIGVRRLWALPWSGWFGLAARGKSRLVRP
jgi:hypothetical protein